MSVPDQPTIFYHTGNGVTTTFAYGCYILLEDDLVVALDGVEQSNGFTVNGVGSQTGGAVIFVVAPADGVEVALYRRVSLERTTDYQRNGDLRSDTMNRDFDRIWMAIQDFNRDRGSSLRYPLVENLDGTLPSRGDRLSMLLGFSPLNGRHMMVPLPASVGAGDMTPYSLSVGVNFNAGDTVVTLPRSVGAKGNLTVNFDGGPQEFSEWSVLGTALTFASPIPNFVTKIWGYIGTNLSILIPPEESITDDMLAPGSKIGNHTAATYSLWDFGGRASKTAAQNLQAFKDAIAAMPAGATLVVPADSGVYNMDATGGLSNAAVINKKMTIRFEGDVKSNFGTMQANPPSLFNVSADDVTFDGSGRLIGDGTKNDLNAGDDATFPRLVHVTGNRFKVTSTLTIDTPPKVGIELFGAQDADIRCKWIGGIVSYTIGNTAYFGVRTTGGGRHFIDLKIMRDASGGRLITGVFSGGNLGPSNDLTITGDADVHEKLAYLFGDRNVVALWRVRDAQQTDIVRVEGSHNKVHYGYGYNVKGGVSAYDGIYNEIADIHLNKVGQIAVYVGRLSGSYIGGFTGTKIRNITATADGTSSGVSDGVFVNLDGADSSDIELDNITVQGFGKGSGEGGIRMKTAIGFAIRNSHVKNCFVADSAQSGIVLDRVIDSVVEGNQLRGITGSMLVELGGANNAWIDNRGRSIGSIGIAGLDASSYGRGNQYTSKALIGKVTLVAAAVNTITHGGVAPNAVILLRETNSNAGIAETAKGNYYTGISGNDFTIATANGTAAAGTEQFAYEILQ